MEAFFRALAKGVNDKFPKNKIKNFSGTEHIEFIIRELRNWQDRITDARLRTSYMHVIGLSLLIRYRWYKMPEEAFTHADFFLQHAHFIGDPLTVSMALCNKAFNYLWNGEPAVSRSYFLKVISLLEDKNHSPLLMAYNYITASYRMQNNLAVTEQWAHLTLDKAISTDNLSYVSYAYANLAWINAKRNNWLYAEDYSRKAQDSWNAQSLFYSYSFILIECHLKKNEMDEAGKYAFKLLHPKAKKLPSKIVQPLKKAVSSWIKGDERELECELVEALEESKILGYY
ncbi:MAG: hypothetical protein ABIN89_30485 [Chitinophagaceae bacterium]